MAFIDEILKRQEQQNNAQEIRIMRLPDKTQDLTAMGLPDITKAPIYPAAAQAFGNVPVNMPPNPLDTSPQISAPAQRLDASQQEPQLPVATEGVNPLSDNVLPPPPVQTGEALAAPQGGLTTAGGTPLSQFLEGGAIPEAGIARPESGLYSSESRGISGAAGRDIMAQASAEREARLAARPDFMEAQKRSPYTKMDGGAGELSLGDYRNLAREAGYTGSAQITKAKQMKAEANRGAMADVLGAQKTQQESAIAAEKAKGETAKTKADIEYKEAQTQKILSDINKGKTGADLVSSAEMQKAMTLLDEYNIYFDEDSNKWMQKRGLWGKSGDIEVIPDSEAYKTISATKGGAALLQSSPTLDAEAEAEFSPGERREQGGVVYEFDGTNWNPVS